MKKRWIAMLVLAFLVALASWLFLRQHAGPDREAEGALPQVEPQQVPAIEPIRIAFNTWIGYSSFYIAEELDLFDQLGIRVSTQVIDPLAEKNAALIRDDIDGMGGTIDSAIISASAQSRGKIVFMFDRSNGTDGIVVAGAIEELADLRGASIAVEEGFVGHFFLLYLLDKEGISPAEIRIVPMTTDQAGSAFVSGNVDAAVTWEPYLSKAAERRGSKLLVTSAQVEPILADTLYLSDRFLRERREDAIKLVAALQVANEYWIKNMRWGNQIVAERWRMTAGEVAEIMLTDDLYDWSDQIEQLGVPEQPGELARYLEVCARLWVDAGVIEASPDTSTLIDPRIYIEARQVAEKQLSSHF